MFNPIVDYVQDQINQGRRVGVFSCEDPLNTPFHRDLLGLGDFLHLKTAVAAAVDLATVELGMSHKGINSWLVVGHTDGLKVCGAINLVMTGHDRELSNLRELLTQIQQTIKLDSTLAANVANFAAYQCLLLREHVTKIQPQLPRETETEIPIRAGIIRHLGNRYTSELTGDF